MHTRYEDLCEELQCENKTIKCEEQVCWFIDNFERRLYPEQQNQAGRESLNASDLNFSTADVN